jgi:penicillin-binding protein 1A
LSGGPYAPDDGRYPPGNGHYQPDYGQPEYYPPDYGQPGYVEPDRGRYPSDQQWPDAQEGWGAGARSRRRHRWLRRILALMLALALLGGLVFATLIFMTPSVSNAPALAQGIALSHHAAYPGPPVPARFADSLVSTEDHRFYTEPGIDPFAVARAIRGQITGAPDQGGATLYQQLAKMLYTPGQSGVTVEVKQVMLGIKLDFAYSKAQILQMYADVAYYGHGYYGLPAASCGYFGKQPAQLSWPQAAMLAGLVQAPSAYNPLAHYAEARSRQAHVLDRLVATGDLTQAQAARAYHQPVHLVGGPATGCA